MEEKYRYYYSPFVKETLGTTLVGNDAFVPLPITHIVNGYTSKKVLCDYKSIVTPVKHINASDEVVWHMMQRQPKTMDLTKGFPTQRVPVNGNIPRIVENIKDMDLPTDERKWLTQNVFVEPSSATVTPTETRLYDQNFLSLQPNDQQQPSTDNLLPSTEQQSGNALALAQQSANEQINIFERNLISLTPSLVNEIAYETIVPSHRRIMSWLREFSVGMDEGSFQNWLGRNVVIRALSLMNRTYFAYRQEYVELIQADELLQPLLTSLYNALQARFMNDNAGSPMSSVQSNRDMNVDAIAEGASPAA